ncbi:MAG: 6-bladed beta-propeller [Leptospiraceae bacterium]|nr:6-bladed beta-propeller [Leptospiraceae bacterium]MCZ8345287.1 6-bladed beta-propeller [Leptospiraceae bacterium]
MSRYRIGILATLCLLFLGLDFPKFKTGEERAYKNFQNGLLHYNAREYNLAREKFLKVISEKEDFSLARLYLSRALYQSGDWSAALQELEEIQKLKTKDSILKNRIEFLRLEIGGNNLSITDKTFFRSIQGEENRGFRFRNPVDIEIDEEGNIYILSFGTTNLVKLDPNFNPVWVSQGGFARQMKGPVAMDYYKGLFYVADFPSDFIFIFNKKGIFQSRIGETGSGLNQFRGPSGITRDTQGNLYISDLGNHRILKWSSKLEPLFAFGNSGKGAMEYPSGLNFHKNNLYAIDKKQKRIVIFDQEGNYLNEIKSDLFKKPRSLEFIHDQIYVSDEITGLLMYNPENDSWRKLEKFKDGKGKIRNVDRPFSSKLDNYGYLFLSDNNRHRIDIFAPKTYLLSNLGLEVEKVDTSYFPSIAIYLRVKSRRQQDILGLKREDFHLVENQNDKFLIDLKSLRTIDNKITVSLAFENSNSFHNNLTLFQNQLESFFEKLTKNDRVELLRSGKDATKILPYTYSKNTIYHAMRTSTPETLTYPGKAIHSAIQNLTHEIGPRAVIYMSSGDVPYSSKQYSLQALVQFAKVNGIQIYPILLNQPDPEDESWKYLAEETGGQISIIRNGDEDNLYDSIKSKLDLRYVISYETEVKSFLSEKWIPFNLDVKYRDFGGRTQGGYFVP